MRILVILLLLCNLTFGQKIYTYTLDLPYPDRVENDSVKDYISKADSVWKKYYKKGFNRVDLEYKNNTFIQLIYDSLGNGEKFIEFFSDTIGVELNYSKKSKSYLLKQYKWYYGFSSHLEYWYPNENLFEYWRYDDSENLEKIIRIKKGEDLKTIEIMDIKNFQESTVKYTYRKIDRKWILDDTKKAIQE